MDDTAIVPDAVPLGKHPRFIFRETDPYNGGPPPDLIAAEPITPNDLFFVRNHAPVPSIDPATYRLRVDGLVKTPLMLSLDDLRRFPRRNIVAVLQCAGNRRQEMLPYGEIPGEIIWGTEGVSNGEWGGAVLAEVLRAAGVEERPGLHVAFTGLDECQKGGETFGFGGSIPLAKALDSTALLADTLNGEPLPPTHGCPLRSLVPGYIGARSVKWLGRVTVQDQPSDNYFQQKAYKLFAGSTTPETVDWSAGMMLGELPLNAIIAQPTGETPLQAGDIVVRGHALAGDGRTVERVDVSADGGATWREAAFLTDAVPHAWRLWEARLTLPAGQHELVARAWDSAAQTQPERIETVWNFKGYMNNAWHRVKIVVVQ